MNYTSIQALARSEGCKVLDLLALAPANDPFYTGMPAQVMAAEWFANLFDQLGFGQGVHLRRIHYKAMSRKDIVKPDGTPYANTEADWEFLSAASKHARNLGLIDARLFVDRRSPEAIVPEEDESGVVVEVESEGAWMRPSLPDLPDWPRYVVERFSARQAYRVEVWVEKSTMNDILVPLCAARGVTLQVLTGEASITSVCHQFARLDDRPLRVIYVSDFDPGGQSMPVAVARKIEFELSRRGDEADIQVQPVVLTPAQIEEFDLPRKPIKDGDRRKNHFERTHGEGAVELDALEALHPGEFRRLIKEAIDQFLDPTLATEVSEARYDLLNRCEEAEEQVQEEHAAEIDEITQKDEALRAQCAGVVEQLAVVWKRAAELRAQMAEELTTMREGLVDDFPLPSPQPAREWDDPLFDSRREYRVQLDKYKRFQGKR